MEGKRTRRIMPMGVFLNWLKYVLANMAIWSLAVAESRPTCR